MPFEFADFAHYYAGFRYSEEQQRTHFEAMADAVECIFRLYWPSEDGSSPLGITLDNGALSVRDGLDSTDTLTPMFNRNAPPEGARKKES